MDEPKGLAPYCRVGVLERNRGGSGGSSAQSSLGLDVAGGSLAQLCLQWGSASSAPGNTGAFPNLSPSPVTPDKAALVAR